MGFVTREDYLKNTWDAMCYGLAANDMLSLIRTWQACDISANPLCNGDRGGRRWRRSPRDPLSCPAARISTSRPRTTRSRWSPCQTPSCASSTRSGAITRAAGAISPTPTPSTPPCASFVEAGGQMGDPVRETVEGQAEGFGLFRLNVKDGKRRSSAKTYLGLA